MDKFDDDLIDALTRVQKMIDDEQVRLNSIHKQKLPQKLLLKLNKSALVVVLKRITNIKTKPTPLTPLKLVHSTALIKKTSLSSKSFEALGLNWKSALTEDKFKLLDRKSTGYWALLNRLIFDPLQLLSAWYRRKLVDDKVLLKRTIPRLIQSGLLEIYSDGEIKLHSAPITPEVANLLAFFIAVLFSLCVLWIVFIADAGWVLIWLSLAIGIVIGVLISALHDFSYSKEVILEKLKQ